MKHGWGGSCFNHDFESDPVGPIPRKGLQEQAVSCGARQFGERHPGSQRIRQVGNGNVLIGRHNKFRGFDFYRLSTNGGGGIRLPLFSQVQVLIRHQLVSLWWREGIEHPMLLRKFLAHPRGNNVPDGNGRGRPCRTVLWCFQVQGSDNQPCGKISRQQWLFHRFGAFGGLCQHHDGRTHWFEAIIKSVIHIRDKERILWWRIRDGEAVAGQIHHPRAKLVLFAEPQSLQGPWDGREMNLHGNTGNGSMSAVIGVILRIQILAWAGNA